MPSFCTRQELKFLQDASITQNASINPLKIDGCLISLKYNRSGVSFQTQSKHMYRDILINNSRNFNLKQYGEFISSLPTEFTMKNRCKFGVHSYYGVVFYKDSRVFTIFSDDKYQTFQIRMHSTCELIKFDENHNLSFIQVYNNERLHKKFFGKTFVHAFLNNFISQEIFEQFHKEIPEKDTSDVVKCIKGLPGFCKIYTTDKQIDKSLKYKDKSVEYLVWYPKGPDYFKMLESMQAVAIDATFCLKDYVLIVPHGIYYNTGVPLGLVIAPSETKEAYLRFFNELRIPLGFRIETKPIICDFGTAIESFLSCYDDVTIYYCLRHYLGRLGHNSPISVLASRILWADTIEVYDNLYEKYSQVAQYLHEKGKITDSQYNAWQEMKSKKQNLALCLRHPRISCNNHIEAFHGRLQDSMKSARIKSDYSKLKFILDEIIVKMNDVSNPSNRNAKNYLKKLQAQNLRLKDSRINVKFCNRCSQNNYFKVMQELYGIRMPCIHNCHLWSNLESPPPLIFKKIDRNDQNQIEINHVVISENVTHEDSDPTNEEVFLQDYYDATNRDEDLILIFQKVFKIDSKFKAFYCMQKLEINIDLPQDPDLQIDVLIEFINELTNKKKILKD